MKLSTVFRRAHALIASGEEEYSCDAIREVAKGKLPGESRAPGALLWWRAHFTPSENSPEHYWLRHTRMPPKECHEWRLTALLFAATICRSEGI
jgi:hypothetical protein